MIRIITILLLAATLTASAQTPRTQTPPYCQGSNYALQFTPAGWVCAAIVGAAGPQGPQGVAGPPGPQGQKGDKGDPLPPAPSPSECITSHWNGTAWVCVPTTYLDAR